MTRLVRITSTGSFRNTERFFQKMSKGDIFDSLENAARQGVDALSSATPRDSGVTADSWGYRIDKRFGSYSITWTNSNQNNGLPIVILLQYGHGTGTGGYVAGYDFINPAIRPIFDKISESVWKAVTTA